MEIRKLSISRIIAAPYNPRVDLKPGDPEYERLRRSLDEFGCVEPLVWNQRTGNLVGGHQRLKVLIAQGSSHAEVSVVDLSLEKEKALNLALNKISGAWDSQKLAELLEELCALPDFDLEITGFGLDEARQIISQVSGLDGTPETFDVEAELAAERAVVTRPGDLIVLGEHRLLCGDSTDAGQVRRLMAEAGGERAVLFATDPPYCVGYDGTNHPQSRPGGSKGPGSKSRQAPRHPLGQSSRRAGSARPFGAGVLPRRDAAESEDHRVGDWVVREVNAGVSDLD